MLIAAVEAIERGLLPVENLSVIWSDTKLEIPALHAQIDRLLSFVKKMGVNIIKVERPPQNSYWARFLGEGTFASNHFARWCVRDLKIYPIKRALPDEDYIMAVGVRLDKSTDRKRRYEKKVVHTTCDTAGECFVPLDDEPRIFPLLEWKNCNIWDFLMFHDVAQKYPIQQLQALYFKKDTMRYGCWNCTVARDTELLKLHAVDDPRYNRLLEFRLLQEKYTTAETMPQDWIYVWRIPGPRNTRLEPGKETWMASRLTVDTRKRLLTKLLEIQEETGFDLISDEEIEYINECWINFPDGDRKGRKWQYYDGPVQQALDNYF